MLTSISSVLLATFLGLLLLVSAFALAVSLRSARDSLQWLSVSALIETSRIVRNYDCNLMPGYHCSIRYKFIVGDEEHIGGTISFGGFRYYTRSGAERLQELYRAGSLVTAYYDPEDPDASVLEPGYKATLLHPIGLFTAVLIAEGTTLWALAGRLFS